MSYLRLFWVFFKVSVLNELQYRVNFFVELWQSILNVAGGLLTLSIVFAQTTDLNGWSRPELMAVMGIHIFVGGLIKAAIQPNMERVMNDVQQGTLDYALTKPEDSQVMISVREFRIWLLTDCVVGLFLLGTAIRELKEVIGLNEALTFGSLLILGGLMIYSFWLVLTTTAFWFVRVWNLLEIFQSMYQTGRWPVNIYNPDVLRYALTFLVPIAFAVTFPAQALIGKLDPANLLLAAGMAIVLLVISRWFWQFGLRRYSGASA
jgi:viologen exporter family transport system permease protein